MTQPLFFFFLSSFGIVPRDKQDVATKNAEKRDAMTKRAEGRKGGVAPTGGAGPTPMAVRPTSGLESSEPPHNILFVENLPPATSKGNDHHALRAVSRV